MHCSRTGNGNSTADIMIMSTNVLDGVTAIVTADLTAVTVTYDADTAELVFRILQVVHWDLDMMLLQMDLRTLVLDRCWRSM